MPHGRKGPRASSFGFLALGSVQSAGDPGESDSARQVREAHMDIMPTGNFAEPVLAVVGCSGSRREGMACLGWGGAAGGLWRMAKGLQE